jgi:hypothetical protein
MSRKRPPARKTKREQLAPLPEDRRPWYQAPLTLAANGLSGLLGMFWSMPIQKKLSGPRKRRKK